MSLFRQQRGDTIVEVLIALSVLTFVMIIAFASSTRSSESVRSTQERGEALKLAQAQLENLIVNKGIGDGKDCFNGSGEAKAAVGSECAYKSVGGSGCNASTNGYCYDVHIERIHEDVGTPSDPSISVTYRVTVDWDSLGTGQDTVNINYKMFVPNPSYVPPPPVAADPDNPPDDEANIAVNDGGGPGCTVDPGGCPDNAEYHYRRAFVFESATNITAANMKSCTWNYGDGKSETFGASAPQCQVGNKIPHDFPEDPRYPEGSHCTRGSNFDKTPYQVILTINKVSGGSVISNQAITTVPYCSGP